MLAGLAPEDRALVWALLGGVPLYLSWWDQGRSVRDNLAELVCTPGGRLLDEGRLVMASEGEPQGLAGPVLAAIAAGHTKFSQIGTAVRTDPTRVLDRLVESQLVRRVVPVAAAAPSGGRRRLYEVADNFLAFWLGLVSPHRAEIDRGLGASALLGMLASLDDFLSARWEEAFREHLRRLAAAGELGDVLAVGPNWSGANDRIDAVCIAGELREAVLVGAARWAREIDARLLEPALARRSATLPRVRDPLRLAVCARERVTGAGPSTLTVTAEDIFA
jgi:hypothetical protein